MESKDPMFELLSSLEQIVLKKDASDTVTLTQKPNVFTEFELLRKRTGLKTDDLARNGCQCRHGSGVGIPPCETLQHRTGS